jgi:hypothetical protein
MIIILCEEFRDVLFSFLIKTQRKNYAIREH